jgi:hypothetical protein
VPSQSEANAKDIAIAKLGEYNFPTSVKLPSTHDGYDKEHYIRGRKYYPEIDNSRNGFADALYLHGDEVVALVETKKDGRFASQRDRDLTLLQAKSYAYAEEFSVAPPLLVLSDGHSIEIWRRQTPASPLLLNDELDGNLYEPMAGAIPLWTECVDFAALGQFEKEYVQVQKLNQILTSHFEPLRNDLKFAYGGLAPDAEKKLRETIGKKLPGDADGRLDLFLTNSVLHFLNKVLFLKIIESRDESSLLNLFEFVHALVPEQIGRDKRVLLYPALFRVASQDKGTWTPQLEAAWHAYVDFFQDATSLSIVPLLHAAFAVEEVRLPGIYGSTFYDSLRPDRRTLEALVDDLARVKISIVPDTAIGDTYQQFLRQEIGRRRELGSYYTPENICRYLVAQAGLTYKHTLMECAVGTGHIFALAIDEMLAGYLGERANANWLQNPEQHADRLAPLRREGLQKIVSHVYAGDIDRFAIQLTWVRMYLRGFFNMALNIRERDYLAARSPLEPHLIRATDIGTGADIGDINSWDGLAFDRIIANPPYGTEPPASLSEEYSRLYREGDSPLGSNESYGYFLVRAIKDLKEGGRLSFIVSDTFLTLITHLELRQMILATCKILEITLMPSDVFKPHAQTANTCVLVLEKCPGEGNAGARSANMVKVSRNLRDLAYWAGTPGRSAELDVGVEVVHHVVEQRRYAELAPRFPLFIPLEDEWHPGDATYFETQYALLRRAWSRTDAQVKPLADILKGGAGLQTGDNKRFVKVLAPDGSYTKTISLGDVASGIEVDKSFGRLMEQASKVARRLSGITGSAVSVVDARVELARRHARTTGGTYVPFFLSRKGESRAYYSADNFFIEWTPGNLKAMFDGDSCYPRNMQYWFRPGFVTAGTGGRISARYVEGGIPPVNTNLFCTQADDLYYVIGLLNSEPYSRLLTVYVNSTLVGMSSHVTPEDVKALPFLFATGEEKGEISSLVKQIIAVKKASPSTEPVKQEQRIDTIVAGIVARLGA